MRTLHELKVLAETAKQGSLSKAAKNMGLTPAAVSATIKRLEKELDVQLLVRSTRFLRLTQEGEIFLQHCLKAIEIIDDGHRAIHRSDELLTGQIRLSMPSDLGRNILFTTIDEFIEKHSGVSIDVQLTDKLTNLYRENIDLALRYGSPRDSNLISLSVCENNYRVLCASPVYLDHHGSPESPLDLVNHNCLCFNLNGSINNKWSFYSDEHEIEVTVGGNRCSDDGDFVRRWAIDGRGIAYKSFLDVSEDLLSGKLVQLCTEWKGETFPLKLLFTDRRQLTPAVLALKESLSNTCQQAMAKYETK